MIVPFDQLANEAHLWIYQMDRPARPDEELYICKKMDAFCHQWATHGHPVISSYKLLYSQFLIIAAEQEEKGISGCAIDSSVSLLHILEKKLNIDFMKRDNLFFWIDNKLISYSSSNLKAMFLSGKLTSSTLTINLQATTKGEIDQREKIPISDSWMGKYIPSNKP